MSIIFIATKPGRLYEWSVNSNVKGEPGNNHINPDFPIYNQSPLILFQIELLQNQIISVACAIPCVVLLIELISHIIALNKIYGNAHLYFLDYFTIYRLVVTKHIIYFNVK
jgi:hypothetical protein